MEQEQIYSNIYSAFARAAETYANKTALIYLGTRFSYKRLMDLSRNFALSLQECGIERGDRVMIYLPNSLQWVVSWLGSLGAGAVALPITPIYTAHDLEYIANDSGAKFIVCSDTNYGYVSEVLEKTPFHTVIATRLTDTLPWWKRLFGWAFDRVPKGKVPREENTVSFRKMLRPSKSPQSLRLPDTDEMDTAEILYTGGTTKFPKGVPISHGLFIESALEQITMSDPIFPPAENVVIGSSPLFHILGQTTALSALLVGGTIVLMPKVNLDAVFDAIKRFRAKTLIGVPALYRMILEHDRIDLYDLSSLQYCFNGGDVLPVEINKRWKERFHKPIYQGYGATETCGGVTMCRTDSENPLRSIGIVLDSKEVMIVDAETLKPVPPGNPGELLVHSKRMVREYWNKPEETEAAFVEIDGRRYYRTADIVSSDEAGHYYFIDRTVDTIKHKGYRISSSEIESVLQEHPAVIGACAVGLPDEKVGERIKAFVVIKEDVKGLTGYELIKWCRERLVAYKIPQYIEFRDMLPKSKVGKLLRREIRSEEQRKSE